MHRAVHIAVHPYGSIILRNYSVDLICHAAGRVFGKTVQTYASRVATRRTVCIEGCLTTHTAWPWPCALGSRSLRSSGTYACIRARAHIAHVSLKYCPSPRARGEHMRARCTFVHGECMGHAHKLAHLCAATQRKRNAALTTGRGKSTRGPPHGCNILSNVCVRWSNTNYNANVQCTYTLPVLRLLLGDLLHLDHLFDAFGRLLGALVQAERLRLDKLQRI